VAQARQPLVFRACLRCRHPDPRLIGINLSDLDNIEYARWGKDPADGG
jgi:hypothetical protein